MSIFYRISNHRNFIPKYLDNALTDFVKLHETSRRLLQGKAPPNDFGRTVPSAEKYCCRQNREWRHFVAMSTPISLQPCITNFHLHLIQLWWQLFQIFVLNDGDLVLCSNLGGTDHEKLYLATISPSKRVFEKYKPRDLFSEFYGILLS